MNSWRRKARLAAPIAVMIMTASCTGGSEDPDDDASRFTPGVRPSATSLSGDPIETACGIDQKLLLRTWRGYDEERSEDILMVPEAPNFSGSFPVPNHSGPWDYLQTVPLIWYGPNHINANGPLRTPASVTDIYSTAGRLTGVDLPLRQGRVLEEALVEGKAPPKLIMLVVWDGVGRNVLERWPDAWPNLARLEREGTSYLKATVGSSPSITPATHANMGTGTFPRRHRVTGIKYLTEDRQVGDAFQGRDASILEKSTFGDDIDAALGNEPLVGMIAWRSWHLGMLSHGAQIEEGDHDILGLIGEDDSLTGNDTYYSTPDYLTDFPGFEEAMTEADRSDGEADGAWMGHEFRPDVHDNPGWVNFETEAILAVLEREGFGSDDVPDLFATNFKPTDIVGHQYGMDSEEERVVLEAQDAALGRILDYLDEAIEDYVVVLTADHGHTPDPLRTGAWPITNGAIKRDIEDHFGIEEDGALVTSTSAVGIFLDEGVMESEGITATDISSFLNGYTLRENWEEKELPEGYEDRGDERLLAGAFPSEDLPEIMRCSFGRLPDLNEQL